MLIKVSAPSLLNSTIWVLNYGNVMRCAQVQILKSPHNNNIVWLTINPLGFSILSVSQYKKCGTRHIRQIRM